MTLDRYNEIVNQINNATKDITPEYLKVYLRHKYIKQIIQENTLQNDNSTYAIVDLEDTSLYKYVYRTLERLPSGASRDEDLYNSLSVLNIEELKNESVLNTNRYELLLNEKRIVGYLE